MTGSKGTRYSFRTGTDTYSIAAASMPWCVENLGKVWTIIYADYAWGQSTNQELKLFIEKAGGKVLTSIPVPLDTKDFVPYVAQIPGGQPGRAAGVHRLAVGCLLHAGEDDGPRQEDEDVLVVGEPRVDRSRATSKARPKASISSRISRACWPHKNDEFHKEFNKAHRHRRRLRARDRRHARDGQEPRLAGLGGHLRHQGRDRNSGYKTRNDVEGVIQALEGMQMKNSLGAPAGRQAHPPRRSRRHHRLLHQSRRERKVRGQEANSEGRAREEHAVASQSVDDAGVTIWAMTNS